MFDVRPLLTRRRLLSLGLGAGVVVVGGASVAGWGLLRPRAAAPGRLILSADEAAVVVAVADAYFPPGNPFGRGVADVDAASVPDAYIARLFPRERRGLRALLRGLEAWPRMSMQAGAFSTASLVDRQAILRAFDDSSIPERRLLGALLRTVCCMSLFEDPQLLKAIGHRHGCGLPIYEADDAGIG